jgi:hypothetical protein
MVFVKKTSKNTLLYAFKQNGGFLENRLLNRGEDDARFFTDQQEMLLRVPELGRQQNRLS